MSAFLFGFSFTAGAATCLFIVYGIHRAAEIICAWLREGREP